MVLILIKKMRMNILKDCPETCNTKLIYLLPAYFAHYVICSSIRYLLSSMDWRCFLFVLFWTYDCEAFDCFCLDKIEIISCDCSASKNSIDYFNNYLLYDRLKTLLERSYFSYFSYDSQEKCTFWNNNNNLQGMQ